MKQFAKQGLKRLVNRLGYQVQSIPPGVTDVPGSMLRPVGRAIAAEIVANTSAVSVALSRQMLWKMLGADHPMEAHRVDSRAIYAMSRSPDSYEGVQGFLEKRPPQFPMRASKDMPDSVPWWKERPFGDS